jgi:hypothetical protein
MLPIEILARGGNCQNFSEVLLFVTGMLISVGDIIVYPCSRAFQETCLLTRYKASLSFGCGAVYINFSFRGLWHDFFLPFF